MTVTFGITPHHRVLAAEARAAGYPPSRSQLRVVPHMVALWIAFIVALVLVPFSIVAQLIAPIVWLVLATDPHFGSTQRSRSPQFDGERGWS